MGDGSRYLRKVSSMTVFKSRIEMEQVLKAKTKTIENKKLNLTYLGDGR